MTVTGGRAKADFFFGEPANLGLTVNGSASDESPSISADGLSLYFNSNRPGGYGDLDIWMTTRATSADAWGEPVNLGARINTGYREQAPCISANGLELYYASDRGYGSLTFDIWVTTRQTTEDDWGEPVKLGPNVNSPDFDILASISSDGLSLFFDSTRGGGSGNADLWVTTRETINDPWGPPANLGPTVNSAAHDGAPKISADGRTLFFSNWGLPPYRPDGYGNADLWITTRPTVSDPWGQPVNLGPTVNGPHDDMCPSIPADCSTLFFISNRPGGSGNWDLWQAPILPTVDLNGDGLVDSRDMGVMVDHWGQDEPLCDIGPTPLGDGIVDIQDLDVLAEYIDVAGPVVVHAPGSYADDVPCDVILKWMPGDFAETHDVYLGTSFEDVDIGDRASPLGVLVSQGQDANTFDPGGLLEYGQTYYWRIDEVSAPPESTIYRGFVWSFTTEPVSYPLDNVSATASASEAGAGPENTINGSGLNANDEHSTAPTDMWLAGGNGVDPVWIQYEFDKIYKLHEMLVWNYNIQFELVFGFGLKDVTIQYSENGADWASLGDVQFSQAPATATYTADTVVDFGGVVARYVRLTVNSGWGMMGKYGLSEVRFLYIPTRAREPQPADGAAGVSPDTALNWRAGREAAVHEVYFSTDRQAVVDGIALIDTVTETSYQPSALDPGQTYYWKINEVNEAETPSRWGGDVWEFSTAE